MTFIILLGWLIEQTDMNKIVFNYNNKGTIDLELINNYFKNESRCINILSVFPYLGFVDSDLGYRLYDMYDHLAK